MYCQFYGLKEKPFNVTSDPAFFFLSKKHNEALSHLIYGVSQRKGIIVITGEIGTGKTTLCRFFLNQLDKSIKTALILNPYFSETQLLEAIARDFGINIKSKTKLALAWELNKFLLRESELGHNVLLIIDEAQNLKPRILEQVRLLSNLETEKEKLLQIVLIGQPELNETLDLTELRQIRQRVMVRYHILPLDKEEIKEYIYHRLKIAGPQNRIEFMNEAIEKIAMFSKGTPRLINMLCDRALLAGFARGTNTIDSNLINKCTEELKSYCVGEEG
ncbi:MAG: AAA family ATPase [Candidatus Omnitrophica bacterium]|nr:AAA family ATPase [Candidatus Omnitrophota bacterium]